jgi:hypothetical protein
MRVGEAYGLVALVLDDELGAGLEDGRHVTLTPLPAAVRGATQHLRRRDVLTRLVGREQSQVTAMPISLYA